MPAPSCTPLVQLPADTLCLENLLVEHPILEGLDGIALDVAGVIWGVANERNAVVQVVIPDRPGELGRLFQVAGESGVNIEDIGIEHSPGLPVGVAELTVRPDAVARLTQALAAAGWPVRR